MSLAEYKRKRNFRVTAEPSGKLKPRTGWIFVIQKHAASHLHYDFRLQLGDVLKSWAVPKGPSLDPSVKRLAMHVEDHPVEYATFEGIIPQGEYGGGTVMVWDFGDWTPIGDAEKGYKSGRLKFTLNGSKLQGGWMLVRGGGSLHADEKKWLLIKERDDASSPGDDVTESMPLSVISGRTLDEIANARDKVWTSNRANSAKPETKLTRRRVKSSTNSSGFTDNTASGEIAVTSVPGAAQAKMPKTLLPQLATLVEAAPPGTEWLNEIKFDGYRMICRIHGGSAVFISRNQHDWTAKLVQLAEQMSTLGINEALFDGEVVALDSNGISRFQLLQNAFRDNRAESLHYYVFDLLYLNGSDLTAAALEDRKRILKQILDKPSKTKQIHYTDHVIGDGPDVFEEARKRDLEGIISKRRNGPYSPGRSHEWLKTKCHKREEFVIGGYTEPEGQRAAFGALLIGYFNADNCLRFAGKVGTGFSESTLTTLLKRLRPLSAMKSPFCDFPLSKTGSNHVTWTQPVVVAQIEFSDWTDDGKLRHPTFLGLREDKPAKDVVREFPEHRATWTIPNAGVRSDSTDISGEGNDQPPQETSQRVKKSSAKKALEPQSARSAASSASKKLLPDYATHLTHADKILFPDQGATKLDLAKYYVDIAEWLLPQLQDRLVVLVRCPEGAGDTCFYQKHPGPGTPSSIRQIPVAEKKSKANYLLIESIDSLVWLAQMGVLEVHIWGSRIDDIERPDRLVFDLDPDPSVSWARVVESAHQIRQFLRELGLESFLKTTGGKGLHLVLPITRKSNWDEAKAFCSAVAHAIEEADPDRYTSNMSKASRHGKIFIDYLRNQRGATSVAPYSPRARAGAPVSVPIEWDDLGEGIHSDHFNIDNLPKHLKKRRSDPWKEMSGTRQSITRSAQKKVGL